LQAALAALHMLLAAAAAQTFVVKNDISTSVDPEITGIHEQAEIT
jgi:hypothetical protein